MVFRDNFKRFIEEKTGMKTSNFLKELGMSYSVVKSLDEEGIEALTEKQLNKLRNIWTNWLSWPIRQGWMR